MKTFYPTLLSIPAMALAAPSLYATVTVQDMYAAGASSGASTDLGGGIFGYEFTLDPGTEFSAAGHDKLVLSFSSHDGNTAGGNTITNITYDGVSLNEAVFANDNGQIVTAGIYYLDNVATDGTLRIEFALNNLVHFGFGLYAVDGLKPGVQDTGTGREEFNPEADPPQTDLLTNATVTMTTNEGFFVQESTRNNQSLGDDPGDDFDTLYNYDVDSYRGLQQYQVTSSPGDYLAPIGNGGTNFRRVVTAAFEAADGPAGPAADLSGDGDVDDEDLGLFFSAFTGPDNGPSLDPRADLSGDGDVDDEDLGLAFSEFTGPLGPASVPEPTSLALLGLGGLMIARRRR